MGLVSKLGGRIGKKIATAYVGTGKKFHQRFARGMGRKMGNEIARSIPIIGSFKKGGRVKRTGAYLLHRGERVIPTSRCSCSHKRR